MDIDDFKTQLGLLSAKRSEILLGSLNDEDKQKALNVFDKENDELNQSIDIYFRIMGYTVETDIAKISELLTSLENGTTDLIERFSPALFSSMSDYFSNNTGFSASQLCSPPTVSVSEYSALEEYFDAVPLGSTISVSFLADLIVNFSNSKSFNIYYDMKGYSLSFDELSPSNDRVYALSSGYLGARTLSFRNGSIYKCLTDTTYHSPFFSWGSKLSLYFEDVVLYLSDGSLFSCKTASFMDINFRSVTIKKGDNYDNGLLISTRGLTVDVARYAVTLEDDLTWADIVDDETKINFIR